MAQSFTVQLNVGGHRIENVSLNWGLMGSEARQDAPSYGTDIEVPAVVELLDLIASGAIAAEEARDNLNRLATVINERMDREYDELIEAMERPRSARKQERFDDRWVYAISTDENPDSIKIGVAKDIAQRVKSLQVGSATRLELRWSARGGYPLERYLHNQFEEVCTHSEWFDFRGVSDAVAEIDMTAREFLRRYNDAQRAETAPPAC
ncbi:GIY-YIG nuclease family protein [Streptomyces kronopolitis]|uniref:GIY-YIG nuclease family protein n=1 Tax=Streptomyces kronopolitis TaxID=1612435 RepID=UPI0020C03065|nr:GIY-YIG nuclease family protein [Streptomyces kronopolitis]MCL6298707.1 GIY-YIG nuclease family protein [Streptomyces kronopolitis]